MVVSFADVNRTVPKMVEPKRSIGKSSGLKKAPAKTSIRATKGKGGRNTKTNHKYFDLLGLPPEIIMQIFKLLGEVPKGLQCSIDNLDDVHPCYAICSTSKYLQDCYVAAMGHPPKDIEIVLRPNDYNAQGSSINSKTLLKERLTLLGRKGRECITSVRVIGSKLERESTGSKVTRFLNDERINRLDPEDKALIKQHVEQDICGKEKQIDNLFENLLDIFGTERIKKLSIYAGELPASTWHKALASYVQSQSNLMSFNFIGLSDGEWYSRYRHRDGLWPYIQRLSRTHWFDTREEQPSNYPETHARHRRNFESLFMALNEYIEARKRLEGFKIRNDF